MTDYLPLFIEFLAFSAFIGVVFGLLLALFRKRI